MLSLALAVYLFLFFRWENGYAFHPFGFFFHFLFSLPSPHLSNLLSFPLSFPSSHHPDYPPPSPPRRPTPLCVLISHRIHTHTQSLCRYIHNTKKGDKEKKKKKKKGRKSLCVSKSYLQGPRLRDFDFFPSCLVKREREKRRERRRERPCFVSSCSSSSLSTTQLSNVVCELMLLHVADCSLVVIVNCQSADLVLSPSSLSPPYLERRGEENERAGRWSRSLAR